MREDERTSDDLRNPGGVEGWLREELAPDRSTVERVVRRSLAAAAVTRPRRGLAIGVVGAGAIVLVAAMAVFLPRGGPRAPGPRTTGGSRAVEFLTITNVAGEIEVLYPVDRTGDGFVPAGRAARESNHATIFNSNGVVAAFAPTPTPRHFLMGGGS